MDAFSCLYPKLRDYSESCMAFFLKRLASKRHLGSPSHFQMYEFASPSILLAAEDGISHIFSGHITFWCCVN